MSIKANIASETEIAKTCIINSALDDDCKRNLMTLLQKSAMATNGITQEEKTQCMTELLNGLIVVMSMFMARNDQRLTELEQTYFTEHPKSEMEKLQHDEHNLHKIEEFRNTYGIKSPVVQVVNEEPEVPITTRIFRVLEKGYFWIFACFCVCSPFAKDVILALVQFFK